MTDVHISDSLSLASQEGQSDTVKALLDNLTPDQQLQLISIKDKHGETASHWASKGGHTDTVKALLDNLTTDQQLQLISIEDNRGRTALRLASQYGHTDTVKALLDNLTKEQQLQLISIEDNRGRTALHWASKGGHTGTVKALLDNLTTEQHLQLISIQDKDGETALHWASLRGNTETVEALLDNLTTEQHLQHIPIQDKDGETALHWASLRGHTRTVKALLDNLTTDQQLQFISIEDNRGRTAFHWTSLRGHTDTVKALLDNLTPEQQLQLISIENKDGQTALNFASQQGHTDSVKAFLDNLTLEQQLQLISIEDNRGRTALHWTSKGGHTGTVNALLDNLTPEQKLQLISLENKDGQTALHLASQGGHTGTVKALLHNLTPEQQMKLISVRDKINKTACHLASLIKQKATVEAIVANLSPSLMKKIPDQIKKSFQKSYMQRGIKDLESQKTHLNALAEFYEIKFVINRQWEDALKAFTLYNSAAVTFSSSPDDSWNQRAWNVLQMYFDTDSNMSAKTFHQNVAQLHDRRGSIRTELKSHIIKLDGKVRSQTKIKQIQQTIEKSDKKMKEFAALVVEKSLESIMAVPPCAFSVVGLGSLGRGEATPYSDIEYLFLVEEDAHTEYFEQLAVMTYYYIGALRETKLSSLDIEELSGWYVDGRDHGYQIDGITKSSGNVPTGNSEHPNQFIATPGELIKVYKATFEGPDPTEAIKGDISAMLKFTTLLYTHNKKEVLLSDFEAERKSIDKKMNSGRLSVSLQMLLSDIKRYKFQPGFDDYSIGFTLNAKTLLYRFPSLVLLDVSIIRCSSKRDSWQVLESWKKSLFESKRSFNNSLQFLLTYASYSRLRCYLFMDSKNDEFTTDNSEETEAYTYVVPTGGEQGKRLVFTGRKLWKMATDEFHILIERILDMQSHLSTLSNLSTAEDIKQITQADVNKNPNSSSLAHFYSSQWDKVIKADTAIDDQNICYALAHSHLQLKNYKQSMELYQGLYDDKQRLTEYGVKLTEVYKGIGKCNEGLGNLSEAMRMYEFAENSLTDHESPEEKKEQALIQFESAKLHLLLLPNRVEPLLMLVKVLKEFILYTASDGKSKDPSLIAGFDEMSFEDKLDYVNNPTREMAHCVFIIGEIFDLCGKKHTSQLYFTKSRLLGLKMVIDKNFDGKTKVAILTDLGKRFQHKKYLATASDISTRFLPADGRVKELMCEIMLTQGELLASGQPEPELEQLPEDKLLDSIFFDCEVETSEDVREPDGNDQWYPAVKRRLDEAHPNQPTHIDYGRLEKTQGDLAKCSSEDTGFVHKHYSTALNVYRENLSNLNAARVLVAIAGVEKENGDFTKADDSLGEAERYMEEAFGEGACNEEYVALVRKRGIILRALRRDEQAEALEKRTRDMDERLTEEKKSLANYISQYCSKGDLADALLPMRQELMRKNVEKEKK